MKGQDEDGGDMDEIVLLVCYIYSLFEILESFFLGLGHVA